MESTIWLRWLGLVIKLISNSVNIRDLSTNLLSKAMAVWSTFPRRFIFLFTFVICLSITMAMLKCCNECPQQYEATNLQALKIHQRHCEMAQRQHTQSMQTQKMGLAKDRKQRTALHARHIAGSNTDDPDMEVRMSPPLLDPLN